MGWGGADSHDFRLEPINNQPLLQGTRDREMCVKPLTSLLVDLQPGISFANPGTILALVFAQQ